MLSVFIFYQRRGMVATNITSQSALFEYILLSWPATGNFKAIHIKFNVVYVSTIIIWNVSHRPQNTYWNWPMKEMNGIALLVYPIYSLITPLEMNMIL